MAEDTGGEKTLPASPRKRQRAREEGNVARSQDLNAAVMLFAALLALRYAAPPALETLVEASRHYFGEIHAIRVDTGASQALAIDVALRMARTLLPFMAALVVTGLVVNFVQVGFAVTPKALGPKFNRINPLTGFGRFFSLRSGVELVKSLFKLVFVSVLVYFAVDDRWGDLLVMMHMSPLGVLETLAGLIFAVWWRVALAMLVLGILDFGFQKWQHERDLRMTQKEAREEMREMEGDPRVKQRIRQIMRQMATQRMMKEVPTADVVVTNPTHYAVALRYDAASMEAPVVVAKGMRLLARRIRQVAVENDVPIVEKPELARTLYKALDVGQSVPENLFRAVAEVLAFVYRIDRRTEKIRERARANTVRRAV